MSCFVAAVGDLHIGSRTGLCPLRVELDSGGEYLNSPLQRVMMARAWNPFQQMILRQSDERRILVLNGDIVDLDVKRRGEPLISLNPNDIVRAAFELLGPFFEWATTGIIMRGITAHVGLAACFEEQLASQAEERWPGKLHRYNEKTMTHQHLTREIEGVRFDIAHHTEASPGRTQIGRGTYANKLGIAVWNRYMDAGEKLPNVVMRSHQHYPAMTIHRGMHVFGLPAWQFPTEFVHRIGGAEVQANFGGAWLRLDDGKILEDDLQVYIIRKAGLWQKL